MSQSISHSSKLKPIQGFTMIEAIVSMVIFAIAFTGLYLLFGIGMTVANNTQIKMHLNLMANQIVETIAAEAQRSTLDPLNPFVDSEQYAGNLHTCSAYTNIRQTWCNDLNEVIGPHAGLHDGQKRTIGITRDGGNLIVDIEFVVGGTVDGNNTVQVVASRKIRP